MCSSFFIDLKKLSGFCLLLDIGSVNLHPLTLIWVLSRMERWSELWNVRRIKARQSSMVKRRARRIPSRRATRRRNSRHEDRIMTSIFPIKSREQFQPPYLTDLVLQFSWSCNLIIRCIPDKKVDPGAPNGFIRILFWVSCTFKNSLQPCRSCKHMDGLGRMAWNHRIMELI